MQGLAPSKPPRGPELRDGVTWRSARLNGAERSRARTAAQARSCFLLGSAVCGGAAACARGSPRARNPRGRRIRNLAGGDSEPEQSRLRSRSCCTARHSHRTPSSLDGQEEHHRAHMRLACGGAGQRWFFLALNWQGSSPLTQRKHSPAPSRQCRHHCRRGLWLRPAQCCICFRCV